MASAMLKIVAMDRRVMGPPRISKGAKGNEGEILAGHWRLHHCAAEGRRRGIDGWKGSVDHHGMETPEQIFREFLRKRKLKYTTERLAILKMVQKFGRPFEAEELLLELREADYRVSKATIYRTLKHLLDAGLLKQVHFGGGKQSHYDFVQPDHAHDHLVDLETGKIIPFSSEQIVKLREEIAREMGFKAVGHRFQIIAKRRDDG
jgi:Fur family ferric uptake transcriptional regulator